jgi:demethylmenaquinone methyltransferase/2-methoxy-6-polyprenyl-1,4-benzoquinol methylase
VTTPSDPALPQGDEKARVVRTMFDRVAGRYDVMNRMMTLGLDVGWRRRTIEELRLPAGARVLDLACGTGDLCIELDNARHRPVGLDFAFAMLEHSRAWAPLVQADALALPVRDGAVDGVTCGFALRNVTSIDELFGECARVVRSGGRVAFLETAEPDNPVLRTGHHVYFRHVVPLVGGVVSDRDAYTYLPRSMAYLPEPEELQRLLRAAGFTDVRRRALTGGVTQLITGTRA